MHKILYNKFFLKRGQLILIDKYKKKNARDKYLACALKEMGLQVNLSRVFFFLFIGKN
jgi:hypothetical protein